MSTRENIYIRNGEETLPDRDNPKWSKDDCSLTLVNDSGKSS